MCDVLVLPVMRSPPRCALCGSHPRKHTRHLHHSLSIRDGHAARRGGTRLLR